MTVKAVHTRYKHCTAAWEVADQGGAKLK